jgi:hypothetical protein
MHDIYIISAYVTRRRKNPKKNKDRKRKQYIYLWLHYLYAFWILNLAQSYQVQWKVPNDMHNFFNLDNNKRKST